MCFLAPMLGKTAKITVLRLNKCDKSLKNGVFLPETIDLQSKKVYNINNDQK